MARVRIAQKDFDQAEKEMDLAHSLLPDDSGPYFQLILNSLKGDFLLARKDNEAIGILEKVVTGFENFLLPDQEIQSRISLAKALMIGGFKARAEQCLLKGLRLARSDGYGRYTPILDAIMTELDLVEGILDEKDRKLTRAVEAVGNSYIIREKLGEGSFGQVYRAFDQVRGMEVAYKRFSLNRIYNTRERSLVIQSARTELESVSLVRHPSVARVFAVGPEPEGGLYVVQEFISGPALNRHFQIGEELSPLSVLAILAKVGHALQALHDAGVVHRDIKPENILIRPGELPVLVDFGVAHQFRRGMEKNLTIMGSPLYMAPEQWIEQNQA